MHECLHGQIFICSKWPPPCALTVHGIWSHVRLRSIIQHLSLQSLCTIHLGHISHLKFTIPKILLSPFQPFTGFQSSQNAYLALNANCSYQKRHAVESKFGNSILPECSLDPNRSRVAGWHTGGLWRISWVRGKTKTANNSSKQAEGPENSQSMEHEQLQSREYMRVCPRCRHACKQECTRSHICHTQQSESASEGRKMEREESKLCKVEGGAVAHWDGEMEETEGGGWENLRVASRDG